MQAGRLTRLVLANFLDKEDKLFYFTSSNQKDLVARRKDLYDSAIPSGNSTMVGNLQRLSILPGKEAVEKTKAINETFLPNKVVMASTISKGNYLLLKGKKTRPTP